METGAMNPTPLKKEEMPSTQPSTGTSLSKTAGILLILAGVISILSGIGISILATILPGIMSSMMSSIPPDQLPANYNMQSFNGIFSVYIICGIVIVVLAIFTLLGGIMALQKKNWTIALIGAILGLCSIGFFFVSSILSLVALIFLVLSRQEFEKASNIP